MFIVFFLNVYLFERERKREREREHKSTSRGGAERERDRGSKVGSALTAKSGLLRVGFGLLNCEITA